MLYEQVPPRAYEEALTALHMRVDLEVLISGHGVFKSFPGLRSAVVAKVNKPFGRELEVIRDSARPVDRNFYIRAMDPNTHEVRMQLLQPFVFRPASEIAQVLFQAMIFQQILPDSILLALKSSHEE